MTEQRAERRLLLEVFHAALGAVEGRAAVRRALATRPPEGHCIWIGAIGKAARSMAVGALDVIGSRCAGGLLITKPGEPENPALAAVGIESYLGGHPIPTQGSLDAGQRLLSGLAALPPGLPLLFLISGGASSLVEVPIGGLGLPELLRINRWLLGSGLPIDAVNRVRKSVSRIKAGGLLDAIGDHPVRVLAISDVPGDDPGVIGSGLLVPDPDLAGALDRMDLPAWLADWTRRGLAERGPSRGSRTAPDIERVATLEMAMHAAAEAGRCAGLEVRIDDALITGDAARAGQELAQELITGPSGLRIAGGETTVRLPEAPGHGGRNQHLALAAAIAMAGRSDVLLLSAGTDGSDGPTEDAGALVDGATVERALIAGLDPRRALANADSGTLLEATGDLLRTGPTGTNVMDLILGWRA